MESSNGCSTSGRHTSLAGGDRRRWAREGEGETGSRIVAGLSLTASARQDEAATANGVDMSELIASATIAPSAPPLVGRSVGVAPGDEVMGGWMIEVASRRSLAASLTWTEAFCRASRRLKVEERGKIISTMIQKSWVSWKCGDQEIVESCGEQGILSHCSQSSY